MLLRTPSSKETALVKKTVKLYYSSSQVSKDYLNFNPNDIYSPFYIPTDNHLISSYTKQPVYRDLANGNPVFHALLRDPKSHKPNGFQKLIIDNKGATTDVAAVSYIRWIANLQQSLIHKNFVSLEGKLDDSPVVYINLEKNKFNNQLNLHPFADVTITEELIDEIIANCTSKKLIADTFDYDSFIDFFLALAKDKEFYMKNHVVIHKCILRYLFNGIPESVKLSNFFITFIRILNNNKLINCVEGNTAFNKNLIDFTKDYYKNLSKVNIDGVGVSSNFLSYIMDLYVNVGEYKKAHDTLKHIMHTNHFLPRSDHLANYIRNVNDPAMLSGVISALRFENVDEEIYKAIFGKTVSFDQIKFILDLNPGYISKNIQLLNPVLTKLFEIRNESIANLKSFSDNLNYVLQAFKVQEYMLSTKGDEVTYLNIIKALKLSGNYYLINKYLNKYNLTKQNNQELKKKIQEIMKTTPSSTELFESQVLQNGFIEIVNSKLDL